MNKYKINISIIGLGYVGLPIAIEFSKKFNVIAYDTSVNRINELKNNHDSTQEIKEDVETLKNLMGIPTKSNTSTMKSE